MTNTMIYSARTLKHSLCSQYMREYIPLFAFKKPDQLFCDQYVYSRKVEYFVLNSSHISRVLQKCKGLYTHRCSEIPRKIINKRNNSHINLFVYKNLHIMPYRWLNQVIIRNVLFYWPKKIKFVPEDMITFDLMCYFINVDFNNIMLIPKHLITREFAEHAISQAARAVKYIPHHLITEEMMIKAVSTYRFALKYAPNNMKTPNVVIAAVKYNKIALQFVPEHMMSYITSPTLSTSSTELSNDSS